MVYQPPKSFFERIECCDDYQELSSKSKALFIILSILLVGGGTLGCFAAAGVFSGTAIGVGSASVEEGACLVNGTQYTDGANVPSDNACELQWRA